MIRLPLLDPASPERFPEPRHALAEPNGLLAFGGDLSPRRLLAAYERGIFPWFNPGEPILWWSPDPRCVFDTATLKANRSLRRALAGRDWRVSVDQAFLRVMHACAAPRPGQSGTWIGPSVIAAYTALHIQGHAHSVEVWEGEALIGGVYGVSVGRLFCGESMFSAQSGGSKLALVALATLMRAWGLPLLDAQVSNPHLLGLGAHEVSRETFLTKVRQLAAQPFDAARWRAVPERAATDYL